MHSIQMKTTLLTVCTIVVAMLVATVIGVVVIRDVGNSSANELLLLLCETGEKNLDSYFESVEQSVDTVSSIIKSDLGTTELADLSEHVDRMRDIFAKAVNKTNGVLTYYYRLNPTVAGAEKGFWYTDLDGEGFEEHEVTDITLYDTADTSSLVWFTIPMNTGKAVWLPSYITDTIDIRVISYNVPVYKGTQFVGVVGIEIDYTMLAEQVDNIKLYENGYAFVNDEEGNLVYHPRIDVAQGEKIPVPKGMISTSRLVEYTYEGVEKKAVWMPLSNGFRLNVAVPVSEINAAWLGLIYKVLNAAAVLLVVFSGLTVFFTRHFTKPLRDLTEAANKINAGDYDVKLEYHGNDEIAVLTTTVNKLITNLRGYIADLNSLAYGDALTSVRNKGAFDIYVREIQTRLDDPDDRPEFAIGIFDCDDLKTINDRYGHEKGDMYLTNSSHLICRVFQSSPVFRIGGDEFAVVLQNEDYKNRDALQKHFVSKSAEICAFAKDEWEKIRVAHGIAAYNPQLDKTVEDVIRRADRLMYANKRAHKENER